jgi:hypothetical protein
VRAADAATESAAKAIAEAFGLNPAPGLDAAGRGCWLWALRADGTQEARAATIGEVLAALSAAGYAVVRLPEVESVPLASDDGPYAGATQCGSAVGLWKRPEHRAEPDYTLFGDPGPGWPWHSLAEIRARALALLAVAEAVERAIAPAQPSGGAT